MMSKLKEAQAKVEETKKRLDTVLVDENSSDGKIKITLTANRTIRSISIDDSLLNDVTNVYITCSPLLSLLLLIVLP